MFPILRRNKSTARQEMPLLRWLPRLRNSRRNQVPEKIAEADGRGPARISLVDLVGQRTIEVESSPHSDEPQSGGQFSSDRVRTGVRSRLNSCW